MTTLRTAFEDIWSVMAGAIATSGFFELSAATLPLPPPTLAADDLCITKHLHLYGALPADAVSIEADKITLGQLGLLIFSTVLHPAAQPVTLTLTHERSSIRQLIISPALGPTGHMAGLHLRPVRFNYYPEPVAKHPWLNFRPYTYSNYDLPILALDLPKKFIQSYEDLEHRSTAEGFGSLRGSCHFAELLLNASQPSNTQLEFALECECGFRGVGPGSAEISVWLPGSIGNLGHDPIPDA